MKKRAKGLYELEKIKSHFLDSFIKIKLFKKDNICQFDIIEYNSKAKIQFNINETKDLDLISKFESELSDTFDWKLQFDKLCYNKEEVDFNVSHFLKNKDYNISIIPLKDNICIINIRDITKTIKQEENILELNKLQLEFADQIPEIICEVDLHGKIYNVNKTTINTFGYSKEEFSKGISFSKFLNKNDYKQLQNSLLEILDNKNVLNQEYTLNTRRGQIHVILNMSPIVINNTITGARAIITNITGMHQLTSELQISEEKYRRVIENSMDAILITQDGKIVYSNNNIFKFYGYKRENVLGKNITDFLSDDEKTRILNFHKKRTNKEAFRSTYETTILNIDKKKVSVELSNSLFTYKNKPAILTFIHDLTEIKTKEKQLRQYLMDFEQSAENINSIIWKTKIDNSGEFHDTQISKVADKLLNNTDKPIGNDFNKFISFIHPEDINLALDRLQESLNNPGVKMEMEYRVIKANKEAAWFYTQGNTEYNEENELITYGVTMDISRRKTAELKSFNQKKFLHRLLNTIPSIICVKNHSGEYITANKYFAEQIGKNMSEIIGKTDMDLFDHDLATEIIEKDKNVISSGIINKYNETIDTPKGLIIYETTRVPLKNINNKFDQILVIKNDITEQSKYHNELQKKSKELLLLTENIDIQIWYLKSPDTYGIINKAHAEFLGKDKIDIEHKYFKNIFPVEFAETYISNNKKVFDSKETSKIEEWNIDKNHERRLLSITKTPMINKDGEVSYVICMARDITEDKKAETSLMDALDFNRSLIEHSPMGIVVYQQDGQCIRANKAAANIIGANSENQLLQQNIYNIEHWEKSELTELFTKCKIKNKTINDILTIKTSFGKTSWIDLSFIPINYKNEKHVMAMYNDITKTKKGELKLKTLSLAVESAPASIIVTDPNSNIEFVNKMFEEVTGYKSDEVIGKNPRLLSSNTHSKTFYKNLWDTILEGKTWKGEFLNKRKNGEIYYESAMISSIRDNEGNITNFVSVKEDITEFKASQKELLEAKQNAELANIAKSEFLANMSHEIRTPMNSIIGFSDILLQKINNPKHLSYLDSIQASSKTLLNLINDILDLSKIEAGQMKIKKGSVNLNNLISDITQVFKLKIKQKQLELTTEFDTTIPETIYIDDLRMRQILLNLIGNAVKFTNNGYIKIIAEKTKTHSNNNIDFAIHIKDSGIGIIEENQTKIFEAFKQQENQNTRKYGGTGLGLSITKNLVEMQGGRISVESKINEGSTFSIYFNDINIPKDQQNITVSKNDVENFDYKFNNETILIVDDVSSNRFLIQSYLSEANLNIIEAENGAEAIEICKKEKPSIVLMDLRMPILNGIDATNIIKSDKTIKDIPIIAVTASLLNFEHENIQNTDFFSFLDKPVSQEEVINEIIKIIKPSNSKNQTNNKQSINTNNTLSINTKKKELFRNTFKEELADVKDSGNINKIQTIANEIIEFSKSHNIPEILEIATELQFASINFDIEKVDQIFTEFEKIFSDK